MRYVLLMYLDYERTMSLDGEEQAALNRAWKEFGGQLHASGKLQGNDGLAPTTSATTVRQANGRTLLSDGPFAETKEQLGGYFVIDAENLDEAVEWASKMPNLTHDGAVEVRPVWSQ